MRAKKVRPAAPMPSMDRRSLANRHFEEIKGRLIDFVGGAPDTATLEIISRLCTISVRLSQMDRIAAEGGKFGEDDPEHYAALSKTYCEILKMLPQHEFKAEAVNA